MFQKQISTSQKKSSAPPPPADLSTSITAERQVSKVPSIISSDMTIRGELSGPGDLQVEGKVIGRIDVGHLMIAESGSVEGDIVAKAVGIAGSFKGTIKAGSVKLSATAKVEGEILHEVLAIEAGAQLEGQCKRISPGKDNVEKLLTSPANGTEPRTTTYREEKTAAKN
jgi:cytoskeletal protein CcmA (bactofilin family)